MVSELSAAPRFSAEARLAAEKSSPVLPDLGAGGAFGMDSRNAAGIVVTEGTTGGCCWAEELVLKKGGNAERLSGFPGGEADACASLGASPAALRRQRSLAVVRWCYTSSTKLHHRQQAPIATRSA